MALTESKCWNKINCSSYTNKSKLKQKNWIVPDGIDETIHYELAFESTHLKIRKYCRGSLIHFQLIEYTADFVVENVEFCEFKSEKLSFCVFGKNKLTHFNEKLGYTSRILPFEIKEAHYIKSNTPGLILVAKNPYMKHSVFWISKSLNDLYPIFTEAGKSIQKESIKFIDNKNRKILLYLISDVLFAHNIKIDSKNHRFNLDDSNYMITNLSMSYLNNLSSFQSNRSETATKDSLNLFSYSGIQGLFSEKSSEFTNLTTNNNTLKLQQSILLPNDQKHVTLVQNNDKPFSTRIHYYDFKNVLKWFAAENVAKYKFIYFLDKSALLTITSVNLDGSVSFKNMFDIIPSTDSKIVLAIDIFSTVWIFSGQDAVYKLPCEFPTKSIFFTCKYDKVLMGNNVEKYVVKMPMFFDNIYKKFATLLSKENSSALVSFYSDFVEIYFSSNLMGKIGQVFLKTIHHVFKLPPNTETIFPKSIQRMKFALTTNSDEFVDFTEINNCFKGIRLSIYNALIHFFVWLSVKKSGSFDTSLVETCLNNIYKHFKSTNTQTKNKSQPPQNYLFDISNLHHPNKTQSNFISSLTLCKKPKFLIFDDLIEADTKKVSECIRPTPIESIFPLNFNTNIKNCANLQNTQKYLDWSAQYTFITDSESGAIDAQLALDNEDEEEVLNNQYINREKFNFALALNIILSKPVGVSLLNFGMGFTSFDSSSFVLNSKDVNLSARLLLEDNGKICFNFSVPLKAESFYETFEWPLFHNGVSVALTHIKPNSSVKSIDTCRANNINAWIHSVYKKFKVEEVAGFIFGCGLLGHLIYIPVLSPGYLLNFLLESKPILVCSLLLGMGVSHIFCSLDNNDVLTRKLRHIYFIHSGLSKLVSEPNGNTPKEGLKDVFDFQSIDFNTNLNTQIASIISLGLIHFASGDHLMLDIFHRFFDTLVDKISSHSPANCDIGGVVFTHNVANNHKSIVMAIGINIGLINAGRSSEKSQYTWDRYYGNIMQFLLKSTNTYGHFLEAALIMIGMTYIRSDNANAAKLVEISLDYVQTNTFKPYLLFISYWVRGLILPSALNSNEDCLFDGIPEWIVEAIKDDEVFRVFPLNNQYVSAWSAFCGHLYAISFKFASTNNLSVWSLLHKFINRLTDIATFFTDKYDVPTCFLVANLRDCLGRIILGASLVFAGSCYPQLKTLIAETRNMFKPDLNDCEIKFLIRPELSVSSHGGNHAYGFHFALNMAHGIVNLGCGNLSFLTTPLLNYCMLFLAFYPVFPNNPSDNHNFFQPLRYLSVLSCTMTKRLILYDMNKTPIVPQPVCVVIKTYEKKQKQNIRLLSSYKIILPEPHDIEYIKIKSLHYKFRHIRKEDLELKNIKRRPYHLDQPFKILLIPSTYFNTRVHTDFCKNAFLRESFNYLSQLFLHSTSLICQFINHPCYHNINILLILHNIFGSTLFEDDAKIKQLSRVWQLNVDSLIRLDRISVYMIDYLTKKPKQEWPKQFTDSEWIMKLLSFLVAHNCCAH